MKCVQFEFSLDSVKRAAKVQPGKAIELSHHYSAAGAVLYALH